MHHLGWALDKAFFFDVCLLMLALQMDSAQLRWETNIRVVDVHGHVDVDDRIPVVDSPVNVGH